jgi:hypothetical protein
VVAGRLRPLAFYSSAVRVGDLVAIEVSLVFNR